MGHYTKNDIINLVEEEDVEFIRLQFADIYGNLKNVAVTTSQLSKVLDNQCMFDGSSINGFANVEDSDLYLHPDLDTFEIFPWRPQQGKVARFLCDICRVDGTPFEGDPRNILKRVVNEAYEMGYTFNVGPECEFFLFDVDENGNTRIDTKEKGGYFDIGPIDMGENARREMILTLEQMGFEVESSHHESAPAQHEIDFKYDDALKTADNIMTFKLAVRTVARRHGLHATFMPKPIEGVNGSGMHINMSLAKDGINVFYDENDKNGLSKEAYHFIAGIMKHIKEMALITNPIVNSYKRLVSGFEAPVYIAWSFKNRSPLIRIPSTKNSDKRIELRCPDSSANPYLTLAVCLAAGLDGIRNELMPPESIDRNIFTMPEKEIEALGIDRLPRDLKEAINEFENSSFIKETLGSHTFDHYLKVKKKEWEEYSSIVTQWEVNKYLERI